MGSLLLRGGMVADGIGSRIRRADVLIEGPVITWIGTGSGAGGHDVVTLEAGSILCPGFIDAHVHAELPVLTSGGVEAALAQGVTTLVVGQDGSSWIGAGSGTIGYLDQYFGAVNGVLGARQAMTVSDFSHRVAGRLTQNVAVLASHGTIRCNVGGFGPGRLTAEQQSAAVAEVEQCLAEGAVGLSSGFDSLPSRHGDVEELVAFTRPLAGADRPYVSHLREYGPLVRAGLAELVAVGRRAGVRVHASHLWGTPEDIAAEYRAAAAAGVSLSHDMYPYRRSSTILSALLLPTTFLQDGPAAALDRLSDPVHRAALVSGPTLRPEVLDEVVLGHVPDSYADDAGLSVTSAAARHGKAAGEWVLDLLVDAQLLAGGHRRRPQFREDHMWWILHHDAYSAGSDGIYLGQRPHPRGYGTFARLARHYLNEGPELGYQLLARHAAAQPAAVYGLTHRGRLAPGLAADVTVIGPGGLTDRASYDHPRRLATGVSLVLVNGTPVWKAGESVPGSLPGQLITR